jgi:hypothetical protein
MDEVGLPQEEKESLKVLHYLLEGHMSAKVQVGFVGISNHVLDAAKSNRCVMLLREEPDQMLNISRGVLFDARGDGHSRAHHVDFNGDLVDEKSFALNLCRSYTSLLRDDKKLSWFNTFFGLRDFIHFLKAIRSRSTFETMKMSVSVQALIRAVERNFNGVSPTYHHGVFLETARRAQNELVSQSVGWRIPRPCASYTRHTFVIK